MKVLWLKLRQYLSRFVMSFKTTKLQLLYDKDVETLLLSIGELENIKAGKHKCHSCGVIITLDNLGAIFRENGKYYFLCNENKCLTKFLGK
jgi:hypothetical protein